MAILMIPCLLPLLLFLLLTGPYPKPVWSMPPSSPITCKRPNDDNIINCSLSNSYGAFNDRIKQCPIQSVRYPTTEDEIRSIVAHAQRSNLKVKVVSGFSHSIPKLACPDPTGSILISTARYNASIEVDAIGGTAAADSGCGLRDLVDRAAGSGLSLVAAPYWEGVSVGGLISSGSHGSSWWGNGGAVHDHVVGVRIVVPAGESEGFARVLDVARGDELFDAVRLSLGLLGVITKVTFSLEPAFKRSVTYSFQDDSLFQDEFAILARRHEFFDVTWYPSQHQAVYRLDDRVPLDTPGDGVNDFLGFQSTPIVAAAALRATEKGFEKSRNVNGKCVMASAELGYKKLVANGLKNSLLFTGYPVVGHQNRMQTSGSCLHSPASDVLSSCPWDPRIKGLFFYESTAIFPASKFRDFVLDVKRLRDLKPEGFCGVDSYNGFLTRFIKGSDAYLGQPEDSVVVDFNYFRADDPSTPRLNEDVLEEVEQMAFFKHGARPHWGKNRKVAFLGVQQKYPSMNKFADAKKKLDPNGMFSSFWSDELISGREGSSKSDGCALEGECICSEDRHCSPSGGYLCRPGLVYQDARVCRHSTSS